MYINLYISASDVLGWWAYERRRPVQNAPLLLHVRTIDARGTLCAHY